MVATAITNLATYGYTIVSARILGPQDYSAVAAILGLLLVLAVVQLGLQTTGARRIAEAPAQVGEIERALLRVSYQAAFALSAVCLVLTPLFHQGLKLGLLSSLLVAVSVWPLTVVGGQAGVLQGERRWLALSAVYLGMGVPRFVLGTAMLLWRPTETVAVLAIALGLFFPVVAGWIALRRSAVHREHDASGAHGARAIWREAIRNSHALVAFLALANADVILARSILDNEQAGLYASGMIMAKAVLFLPQFVVVVTFPDMAAQGDRRRTLLAALGVVGALGMASTAGAWVLSGFALEFVGGAKYAAVRDDIWVFALLGTVLAMIQLLVYNIVARQRHRIIALIWASLALLVAGALRADDERQLVWTVLAIDAALWLALLLALLRRPASGPASGSVGGVVPAATGADRDVQRDGEVGGRRHLLPDE